MDRERKATNSMGRKAPWSASTIALCLGLAVAIYLYAFALGAASGIPDAGNPIRVLAGVAVLLLVIASGAVLLRALWHLLVTRCTGTPTPLKIAYALFAVCLWGCVSLGHAVAMRWLVGSANPLDVVEAAKVVALSHLGVATLAAAVLVTDRVASRCAGRQVP